MWKELIKKIELQSILVLLLTLLFGWLLLENDNTLSTPAGILGSISITIGILYTFGSFFSNQIRESYSDVISEYKQIIDNLKASNQEAQKYYKDTLSDKRDGGTIGDYQTVERTDDGTQNS